MQLLSRMGRRPLEGWAQCALLPFVWAACAPEATVSNCFVLNAAYSGTYTDSRRPAVDAEDVAGPNRLLTGLFGSAPHGEESSGLLCHGDQTNIRANETYTSGAQRSTFSSFSVEK